MKMVKSLLLGSAAGLVAVAGAQAADLPVKAQAVEYVKVCTAYGAGFYYIPGTDTCLKIGGFVRADIAFNGQENGNTYRNGGPGRMTTDESAWYNTRYRGIVTFDARSQTEWGTLRSYIRAGWELNSNPVLGGVLDNGYRGNTYFDRAFIQFAGLTVGKTQSFFDFYAQALNYTTSFTSGSDTGHGINLIAYTAQFGGGISATISLEDAAHRRTAVWDVDTNGLGNSSLAGVATSGAVLNSLGVAGFVGGTPGSLAGVGNPNQGSYGAQRWPDIVANLRIDQPWGSAQIMGALHEVTGGCFGATCNPLAVGVGTAFDPTGRASSKTGFAVGGGFMFNLPWAQGDQFWVQATYAKGAAAYLGLSNFTTNSVFAVYSNSGSGLGALTPGGGRTQGGVALLWAFDGLYGTGTDVVLTEGWQVNAAVQHYWTPSLRTSIFGGYLNFNYGGEATALFCTGLMGNAVAPGTARNPRGVCNPDFNLFQVGTRTIWSPVRNLDIGVEVLYTKWDQKHVGDWSLASAGSRPAGAYAAKDQDTWTGLLRFQRNFWP
jgi:hypothetical protein